MRPSWTVSLFRHEQPSPHVWEQLEAVVAEWNAQATPLFDLTADYARYVRFEASQRPALDRLLTRLDRVDAAAMHVVRRDMLEDSDFDLADFVAVTGTAAEGLVLNEDAAIADSGACPSCGGHDGLDVEQVAPFVIDETRLPFDGAVDLAGGFLALSAEQTRAWVMAGLAGAEFIDVLESASARVSTRVRQLTTEKLVLAPCLTHSQVVGPTPCHECGRAMGEMEGYFWVRDSDVDRVDVLAAHRSGRARLYLSRRALDALEAVGPTGLSSYDVLRVCQHI